MPLHSFCILDTDKVVFVCGLTDANPLLIGC